MIRFKLNVYSEVWEHQKVQFAFISFNYENIQQILFILNTQTVIVTTGRAQS